MKEFKLVESSDAGSLPAVVGIWGTLKRVLFKELAKPVVLELTLQEEKVFTEVHNFLFQEVKFPELHDFFFQEINLFSFFKRK